MSWNPYGLVNYNDLPVKLQFELAEFAEFENGLPLRYLKPDALSVEEGAFGETFINWGGYKLEVVKEAVLPSDPHYSHFMGPDNVPKYRIKF